MKIEPKARGVDRGAGTTTSRDFRDLPTETLAQTNFTGAVLGARPDLEREKLGSVNLRADEETNTYKIEIKKMEQDREDLVSAIMKLKESINELNEKGRERLLEAFEKVNRKSAKTSGGKKESAREKTKTDIGSCTQG